MENNLAKLILAIIFLLFTSIANAQVHEYVLKNGLKLLVKEDHRAPIVVSQIWYKVGSSYETDGTTGVSHVLEHMMFQGTRKHGEGEFSRIIAENGGSENAFTGADYTAYFQTLEKSRLPISFELEADRMRNITLPPEAFEKEIEVVKEERRLRTDDNPNSYLREVANATAFQTSPYRQPIIGWMADLETMDVADLRSWYKKWYAPNNATLVVVGDIEADNVFKLAKKYFGRLKGEVVIPPSHRPEVEQQGIKRVVVKRPAEIARLTMAYKTPVLKSSLQDNSSVEKWEPYALEMLSGILSGGSSARFASRLVRGEEVATGVNSSYNLSGR
ncbi:MAG: zinc protease, partial [Gammaproteobacteria bacterium]